MRLKSSSRIHADMIPLNAKGPAAGVLAALLLSACGGASGNPTPSPQGSYDLQAAMVALVSIAVTLVPVDPGSPEVVQFTYKVYNTNQALVETDTVSYNLTENNLLSLNSATTQNATGTLTVMPQ